MRELTTERREQIKQVILEAFADVPYPGDARIALHPDSYLGKDAQRALKGHHWRDLSSADIHEYWLVQMWPEARRFYLPAFLLQALAQPPDHYRSMYLLDLVPPEDRGRFAREFDAYTSAQRDAIRMFLACVRDETKDNGPVTLARIALARYWAAPGEEAPDPAEVLRDPRAAPVREAILTAFAEVPYPGDEELAEHPEGQDGPELIRDFKGYGWREVTRGRLLYKYDALSLFSAAGLRFFLPAYLLAGLELDDILFEWSVYGLSPSRHDPDLAAWSMARFNVFGPEERRAIRMFLAYVCDADWTLADHARPALEAYWARDPDL